MSLCRALLLAGLLCAGCGTPEYIPPSLPSSMQAVPDLASAPRARLGHTCHYSYMRFGQPDGSTTEVVDRVGGGVLQLRVVSMRAGSTIRTEFTDLHGNLLAVDVFQGPGRPVRQIRWTQPRRHFDPPYFLGKSWRVSYAMYDASASWAGPRGARDEIEQVAKVVGYEEIEVHAGRFRTVRIALTGHYIRYNAMDHATHTGAHNEEIWLVEERGCMAKYTRYREWQGQPLIDQYKELVDHQRM